MCPTGNALVSCPVHVQVRIGLTCLQDTEEQRIMLAHNSMARVSSLQALFGSASAALLLSK